jgi:DNA-binding GntR family transcriptional regulator
MSKNNKHLTPPSAENIFMNLKADISLGLLHPRERLIEAELVERFNSHRPAVREVLAMLSKLGLVVHIPNKGSSVAELNVDELTKNFEMRIELESLAASWITLPLPNAAIDELVQILKEHSFAIDNNEYRKIFRLDVQFHSRINAHCGCHPNLRPRTAGKHYVSAQFKGSTGSLKASVNHVWLNCLESGI